MPDKLLAQYYWPFRPSWLDIAEIANAAGARMPPRSPCFGRMPPRSAGLRRRLARLAESGVSQDAGPTYSDSLPRIRPRLSPASATINYHSRL